jgi:hypothetical protein
MIACSPSLHASTMGIEFRVVSKSEPDLYRPVPNLITGPVSDGANNCYRHCDVNDGVPSAPRDVNNFGTPRYGESPDQYCKWAWRGLAWRDILDFLEINLAALANTAICWWSESQVETMCGLIRQLVEGNEGLLWDEDRQKRAAALRGDAVRLLQFFESYVAHGARIYVF